MSNSFLKLINDSKFEFNDNITTHNILSLNYHSIQTGIGDILLISTLVRNKLIKPPLFINISIFTDNPYSLNNTDNSFSFKMQLLEKLFDAEEIIFYYDANVCYSDWLKYLIHIDDFRVINKKFDLTNTFDCDYIVFHTKCRFSHDFNYNGLKHNMRTFCKNFKTKYKNHNFG